MAINTPCPNFFFLDKSVRERQARLSRVNSGITLFFNFYKNAVCSNGGIQMAAPKYPGPSQIELLGRNSDYLVLTCSIGW